MIKPLTRDETFLICALREFHFLIHLGYYVTGVTLYFRSVGVSYENKRIRRTIYIEYEFGSGISIDIWGKPRVFSSMSGKDICQAYADHPKLAGIPKPSNATEEQFGEILKGYASLLSDEFLHVIKGERWL